MNIPLLSEKYAPEMVGVLNCYDRVIIRGNLQPLCYAQGMTKYLYGHNLRIFTYGQFAVSLRDEIRQRAEAMAAENQVEIEFIHKSQAFRKEDRIQSILRKRGQQPGLVHIFAAMERCPAYRPWHDKASGKTYVKSTSGKCLHYYFYFIDAEFGLCYLRVPTWCPFGLQFYFNGHNWLASQLTQHEIAFAQRDNAFVQIADFERANQVAAQFNIECLQAKLDQVAQAYCPVVAKLGLSYHWNILQAEYATDLIFKSAQTLLTFFPLLLTALIQAVQPAAIATFLGRKLHSNYQGEVGSRYNKRWLGRRIKHQMGAVTIKMYDKFNLILRIETSVADVSFFQHYRQVHHRDGSTSLKWASMKKTIYSLPALQELLQAANQRYLKFISAIETAEVGVTQLHQLAETQTENEHRYKGFNLFAEEDASLFRTLLRGEFFISGFTNKALQTLLPDKNSAQITRLLARLRAHHLIKKVGQRYKYYLTDFGRQVATMALKLREMVVIPGLASNAQAQT